MNFEYSTMALAAVTPRASDATEQPRGGMAAIGDIVPAVAAQRVASVELHEYSNMAPAAAVQRASSPRQPLVGMAVPQRHCDHGDPHAGSREKHGDSDMAPAAAGQHELKFIEPAATRGGCDNSPRQLLGRMAAPPSRPIWSPHC